MLCLTGSIATAQEQSLERVKAEGLRLRQLPMDARDVSHPAALHREMRDWIESLLPQSQAALDTQLASLEFRIKADLKRTGLSRDLPGQWQIAVDLNWLKGKQLPEALTVYFLVQPLEPYRFRMLGISFDRQEGCPGNSTPSIGTPTLFPATAH